MRIPIVITMLGALLATAPAMADVTIMATQKGKGMMGALASGESITRIKGGKMRADNTGDAGTTALFDLDAQTMASLNHKAKEATVTDLRELQTTMRKLTDDNIKATVTPTGRRQEVAGQGCDEYRIDMTMPATIDPSAPPMTITTTGPFCIVKDAPGKADYANFYMKAAERGFVVAGDPRQAKAQPGRAKSMTELYRQVARLGIPYSMDMDFKFGGDGPMGALMGKLGFGFTSTVTRVSVEPIPDSLMMVPADYRLKKD